MSWGIRRATADDLDAIMAIETTTFPSDAWSSPTMAAELTGPHGYYLVAHAEDGVLDGYAGLLAPEGGPQADIQTIAVTERARRRGLGRTLMLALLNGARRRGATEVFLEVRADNPGARSLYADLGFAQLAVRPRYYQPDGVDALILRLELAEPTAALT